MILEVYTPAQIRACSSMLNRVFRSGKTLHDFMELARYVTVNSTSSLVTNMRLAFKVKESDILYKEDALNTVGWRNLRAWIKVNKLLNKVKLTPEEVRIYVKHARRAELELEETGYIKP